MVESWVVQVNDDDAVGVEGDEEEGSCLEEVGKEQNITEGESYIEGKLGG